MGSISVDSQYHNITAVLTLRTLASGLLTVASVRRGAVSERVRALLRGTIVNTW